MPKFRITKTDVTIWLIDDATDAEDAKTKTSTVKPVSLDEHMVASQLIDAPPLPTGRPAIAASPAKPTYPFTSA